MGQAYGAGRPAVALRAAEAALEAVLGLGLLQAHVARAGAAVNTTTPAQR